MTTLEPQICSFIATALRSFSSSLSNVRGCYVLLGAEPVGLTRMKWMAIEMRDER